MERDNVNTFYPCSFGTRTIYYNRFIIHLLTTFEVNSGTYCPRFIRIDLAFARSIRRDLGQFDPELTINRTMLSNSNTVGKLKRMEIQILRCYLFLQVKVHKDNYIDVFSQKS